MKVKENSNYFESYSNETRPRSPNDAMASRNIRTILRAAKQHHRRAKDPDIDNILDVELSQITMSSDMLAALAAALKL
jgi:hypothetical protein